MKWKIQPQKDKNWKEKALLQKTQTNSKMFNRIFQLLQFLK
uniref:Uncharacterized protein n=1 Tax=Meloidogyne enterolobii TaxID=390850 RepID=A0A6V7WLR2_MELEN|nr:unnamed protein product [Meloidogyne enterolobii]CAD2187932.1 unnamed protein product [Meloidogyne enterolobii]